MTKVMHIVFEVFNIFRFMIHTKVPSFSSFALNHVLTVDEYENSIISADTQALQGRNLT
jgi:hypothetical protein